MFSLILLFFSGLLQISVGTTAAESMNAAANIFLGQVSKLFKYFLKNCSLRLKNFTLITDWSATYHQAIFTKNDKIWNTRRDDGWFRYHCRFVLLCLKNKIPFFFKFEIFVE